MFKKFKKITSMWLSIILFSFSAVFIYIIMENTTEPKNLVKTTQLMSNIMNDCSVKAKELGFTNIQKVNNSIAKVISIKEKSIDDGMDIAYKSTILMNYCKKMTLKEYCLGEDCGKTKTNKGYQFIMNLEMK